MNKQYLELYTDYLLSSFGQTTATGLSRMIEGQLAHDQITRFLSAEEFTSKDLWTLVKPTIREVEQDDAVLIFDDTIQEKPYTDENEVMCWHYDHTKGRAVQGFNLLNCLYHVNGVTIPVAFELIKKPFEYCDIKTRRLKRASLHTKNELMRNMLSVCLKNKLKFRFVLFDTWFSSKENMCYIKKDLIKDFVCALKSNRLAAVSEEDVQANRFTSIEELLWQEETLFVGWLKDVPFPMSFVRQVFNNKDGSTGILYLACSDTTVTRGLILTAYQKRWPVEVFHKSLKQNAALGKAPLRRVITQNNHVFATLYALFKLECLSIKRRLNHFALRAHLYLKAIRIAFDELQFLKAA
jgi:hypothetical protein